MWLRNQEDKLINLDLYESIDLENDRLIARRGREHRVLFCGTPGACGLVLRTILDAMAMDRKLVEISAAPGFQQRT